MNKAKMNQYFPVLEKYRKENDLSDREYDSCLDGFMKACDSPNLPAVKDEAEAFIMQSIKNKMKDLHKAKKNKKEPTMVNPRDARNFKASDRSKTGVRVVIEKTGEFPAFYTRWLFDHNLNDSVVNRTAAEADWDKLTMKQPQSLLVSLEEPIFTGDNEESPVLGDTIADTVCSPEDAFLNMEERDELIALKGLKDPKLRVYLHRFIPTDLEPNSDEIKVAYLRALLTIIARIPNWSEQYKICDIALIARLAGADLKKITHTHPSDAERQLRRIELLPQEEQCKS